MSDRRPISVPGASPADAAAAWLARRDRGLTPTEEREFAAWRDADPRHAEEFAQLTAEWENFDLAKADPELVAMARELDERTRSRVDHAAGGRASRPRFVWIGGLAAAAALVLAAYVWWPRPASPSADGIASANVTYQVVPSDARQLTLPDGSVVALRGDSEVTTDFTAAERRVRLLRGEAHFTVAKNPNRPFIVGAGGIAVRAVGTAFDVRLDSASIEVLVTEGKVGVNDVARRQSVLPAVASAAPVLTAGQRVIIDAQTLQVRPTVAQVNPVTEGEIEQALAWQSTRLIFNRTPLSEAVAAFNRHDGHGERLVLGVESLGARQLGGTFRTDNVDGFVRLLEVSADIRAEKREDGTIVLWPVR